MLIYRLLNSNVSCMMRTIDGALADSKELSELAETSPIPRRRSISQAHSQSITDREQRASIMEGQHHVDPQENQTQLQPLHISR
jgi:hypothetical protein